MFPQLSRDPTLVARVGWYLTDGDTLVWILECDRSGAIGEDALTDNLLELSPQQLVAWRRVIPTPRAL